MKLRDCLFGTLRRQLAFGVALVHAVMMSVFVLDLVVRQQAMLQERQVDEARSLASTLALSARAWVLTRDLAGLAELTQVGERSGVEYVMLTNARGEVLAHTEPARVGQILADMTPLIASPAPRVAVLGSSATLADVAAPVVAAGRVVGWARVGVGPGEHAVMAAAVLRDGIMYTLVAIVIGAVLAVLMSRLISARLQQIRAVADAVRQGHDALRVPDDHRDDEVGAVARGFNAMLDALGLGPRDVDWQQVISLRPVRREHLVRAVRALCLEHGRQLVHANAGDPQRGQHRATALEDRVPGVGRERGDGAGEPPPQGRGHPP